MRPRLETMCPLALAHSRIACVCALSGRALATGADFFPRRVAVNGRDKWPVQVDFNADKLAGAPVDFDYGALVVADSYMVLVLGYRVAYS